MKYIIVPKLDNAADVLSESGNRLDSESKLQNYNELKRLRRDDSFRQSGTPNEFSNFEEIGREIVGIENSFGVVASAERGTIATGVTVVETNEAGAKALQEEFGQTEVIPDDILTLIEPDVLGSGELVDASDLTKEHLWHLQAIGLDHARSKGFSGTGAGVNVSVMDTGVADVPEIRGKVSKSIDLDTDNWEAIVRKNMEDTYKGGGHGTLVAGLIAGSTVGVAPGATLSSVTLLPKGQSHISDYILALEWASSEPDIKIINMSAGKDGFHGNMRLITKVLRRINTVAFMAIGNEGPDSSRSPGNYPEVMSVGASNSQKKIWHRSSGGELIFDRMNLTVPKLVAPGEGITTCMKDGSYKTTNGTSLATPILSGIGCLMLERFPNMTLHDLEMELLDACEDLGLSSERQGKGEAKIPKSLFL